jgi:histidinol-phosphate phosphatase family protein
VRREGYRPTTAFLDRDGTLIRDTGYVGNPDEVVLLPGAGEAVHRLNDAGVPVVIVTNQSGIGRGYFDVSAFRAVQARLESLLADQGARIDGTFHCPHAPGDGCECRKPGLALYALAAEKLGVETKDGLYVGDRSRDVLPAVSLDGLGMLVAGEGGEYDGPEMSGVIRVPDLLTGIKGLRLVPEEDP